MTKGVGNKDRRFVVNLKHDGVFSPFPLRYLNGDEKQLTEFDFEGMSYDHLLQIVKKLVHNVVIGLYYCKVGKQLRQGLTPLANDSDLQDFMKTGYESKWVVDLYVEHLGYEPMDYKNAKPGDYEPLSDDSDAYCSSDDDEVIEGVDMFHTGDEDLDIQNITTNDPFLSKMCSHNGNFRGFFNDPVPNNENLHAEDPDSSTLNPDQQVQRGIRYPKHDPLQPWNQMQPILGMRYDHPEQLKLALANYGVAGGYQLWFQKNDWKELLVYCGRDVSSGRCAGYHARTVKAKKQLFTESQDDQNNGKKPMQKATIKGRIKSIVKKKKGKITDRRSKKGEGSSRPVDLSPKMTKSRISNRKSVKRECGFRLWASWMSTENSFQIKSLKPDHNCARNFNLGSLVTFKWIAHHVAKDIIADPFMTLAKMQTLVKERFMVNVSPGQCRRAKHRALYDYEGGLKEHYGRLWDYRQAILDTNPGSTCVLDGEETVYGNTYFNRFYICFKGVKDGWKAGCRKVIGLDGCFLKHTCRGELLTAIGRDANNQMYPIAWAVVKVENYLNWCWFLSLLCEDLELGHGSGVTVISDSHKGLLDAVSDWLPNAEHRKCTRHVFANLKKKFSGVYLQRLFWRAAGTTVESVFYDTMEQIKSIFPDAYTYLVQRNPNTWSRAFFDLNSKCASFENGIAEAFNRAILVPRTKPIITMLEEIRLYMMQRLVSMKSKAMNLEDSITPSIRKRLELLKVEQRYWTVIQSGFQEVEVKRGAESFGVNLHLKKCMCKLWELSGIPCVHAMAAYMFLNKEPDEGVDHYYSQQMWFEAYQFSIRPVFGSNMWKRQHKPPLLPPIVQAMPGRPKKNRVKDRSENNSQVSKSGNTITCSKCFEKGHNRRGCDKEQMPKPPPKQKMFFKGNSGQSSGVSVNGSDGRGNTNGVTGQTSSVNGQTSGANDHTNRSFGRGHTMKRGGIGPSYAARFQENDATSLGDQGTSGRGQVRGDDQGTGGRGQGRGDDQGTGGRGQGRGVRGRGRGVRGRGRGGRGRGRGGRGRGRGDQVNQVNMNQEMSEEDIRNQMEHEYMEALLFEEEEKRIAKEKEIQEEFDLHALRMMIEEEERQRKEEQDRIRDEEYGYTCQLYSSHGITPPPKPGTSNGKAIAEPNEVAPPKLSRPGRKRKTAESSAAEPPVRIFHKNRGRSERIFNMKMKKNLGFGPNGEGSTPDKAFSL